MRTGRLTLISGPWVATPFLDAMASSAQDISSSHFEAFLLLRSLLGSPHFVMERHEIAAKSGPSKKCERERGDTLFAFWLVCRQVVT